MLLLKEVEFAIKGAMQKYPEVKLTEFTVAPVVKPKEGLPHHEWLIEFATEPNDMGLFAKCLDELLQVQNPYYKDLISGKVLKELEIKTLQKGAFNLYMKTQGRLGGQNKVPRLANDRKIADQLKIR